MDLYQGKDKLKVLFRFKKEKGDTTFFLALLSVIFSIKDDVKFF